MTKTKRPQWCSSALLYAVPYVLATNEAEHYAVLKDIGMLPREVPWNVGPRNGCTILLEAKATGRQVIIVCANIPQPDEDSIGTASLLAHEAVHVFQDIMGVVREKKPGVEIQAYGIQQITDELMRAYCRQALGVDA